MHIYIFWFQKTQSTPPKFVGHRRGNAAPRTVRSDGPQFQLRILGLLQEVLPEKCKATRIFWGISWEISCDMMGTQTVFFFFRGIFDWERFWGRGYTSSLEVRGYTTAILRQVIDLGVACEVPLEVHHPPELRGITQSTWITSHKKELGFFVYFSSFLFDPRSSQQPFCS